MLRYDGETVSTLADLSTLVPANLGDMVVDRHGRAYVGSQAREGGVIVRIDPDDSVPPWSPSDLDFPNGMVITPDGATLIVAESTGRRLTAFTVGEDGRSADRRVFADGLDGPPDGICARRRRRGVGGDDAGPPVRADRRRRRVTDRIDMDDRTAIACALGGPERRTLFLLSTTDAYPERLIGTKLSRLDASDGRCPGRRAARAPRSRCPTPITS